MRNEYVSFDSHKHYTLAERETPATGRRKQVRIEHYPGAIREFLAHVEPGTPVALETLGSWYWIVDEIEQAGMKPLLVHARRAKLMLGAINKTDQLDVHGLNVLQQTGTLPTVWIPDQTTRDLRELTRTRMVLARQRAQLKNRIQATLAKYGLQLTEWSDPFGKAARVELAKLVGQLPPQTRFVTGLLLQELAAVLANLAELEQRLADLEPTLPALEWLRTLPGVGLILGTVIAFELGTVSRFPDAEHFAAYAGTTPRVHSSGDKTRYGQLRPDVNRYLKWAFIEAANSVALHRRHHPQRHVSQRYAKLRERRGHAKAIGAVARHLAEAAYHVVRRQEPYRDPALRSSSQDQSTEVPARSPHEPRSFAE